MDYADSIISFRKSDKASSFPACIRFTNVSQQVSEKLESTKEVPEDVPGDLVRRLMKRMRMIFSPC